jgi:hypothetical protein
MRYLVLGVAIMMGGCALQRATVATDAQQRMIGFTKEQVLACMGPPVQKAAEGATEVWSYASGNGQTNSFGAETVIATANASGGPGYASGTATGTGFSSLVTTKRFCTVNVTMSAGRVSRVNYIGPTGGLLTQGEQCAFAIQNCVQ